MNPTSLKLKIIAVLACLVFPSFAASTHASDFFPLDLWEEMADWQDHNRVAHEADVESYSPPMPVNWGNAGAAHTTFPFDVVEELNALGNSDRHDFREYAAGIGGTHGNTTNPYWLPEELITEIASGLRADNKRNYSN